jgi:hypothetical protein
MKIEVSNGEIVDKISILKIKSEKIKDSIKVNNIMDELNSLLPILSEIGISLNDELFNKLYSVNLKLWDIEDKLRIMESKKEFDNTFIQLARSVYYTNDERFRIKTEINAKTSSKFIEEKSYEKYD